MSRERVYRVEGVILKRHDMAEADRLLTIYTPTHGKLRLIAKGVRRPQSRKGGHVELFTHSSLLVARGRNLDIVTQAETIESFQPLRADLERTAHAYYFAELVDQFAEEALENRPIFELLRSAFHWLGDSSDLWLAARFFEMRLLELSGYRPQLHYCVQDDEAIEPLDNYFNAAHGGILCPKHGANDKAARPLPLNALKALRFLQANEYDQCRRMQLSAPTRAEVEAVLARSIAHILERRLKSADFLRTLQREMVVSR